MIRNNPFLSDRFVTIWCRHFAKDATIRSFDILPSINFVRHRFLPLFTNAGKTFSKGMDYLVSQTDSQEHRKKVFLVYDVPEYFGTRGSTDQNMERDTALGTLHDIKGLGSHRSKQYPGFLIDLAGFKDTNDYLAKTFSKSSRYKLKKYKKRFEASFDVRYVMYRGDMEKDRYDDIFHTFKKLLEKRFDDKQITNNNLHPREWRFYHEVTYPLLLENRASLFVIYNGETPVGVTLNFFSEDILFDAITVFDIDYAKFHLGSITIMALLDWSLENQMSIFDFSKGYFDYKTRWATKKYDFEYHILYDSSSLRARTLAQSLKAFFDFKQWLRNKKINEKLHRLTYRLSNKTPMKRVDSTYSFSEVQEKNPPSLGEQLLVEDLSNAHLRPMVFDFLYLNDEHFDKIKVYSALTGNSEYYLIGQTKTVRVTFS